MIITGNRCCRCYVVLANRLVRKTNVGKTIPWERHSSEQFFAEIALDMRVRFMRIHRLCYRQICINGANKENGKSETDASQQLNHVRSMKQLLQRMQEEGNMYMRLRHEALALQEEDKDGDYSSSDSDSDSDSSSSSSSDDEDGDEEDEMDFAPPGATITMYDSVLDALAVSHTSTNVDPLDIFHTSMHALSANDLDKEYNFYSNNEKQKHLMHQQRNKYTLATPTTYTWSETY